MTEFTPARLAEMRAVAEAATNSAWEQDEDLPETVCASWNGRHWYMDAVHEEDAAHIAAFDPPTVLALIAALEAKTAEVDDLAADPGHKAAKYWKWWQREKARADRAEAALERVKAYLASEAEANDGTWPPDALILHDGVLALIRNETGADQCMTQAMSRAEEAEAAIERVREAATEVTNQENNQGRTHYDNCWKQHLHCLAAKIIHETGDDDE